MKRFTLKRITALVLALIMTLSLCPVTAFATEGDLLADGEQVYVAEESTDPAAENDPEPSAESEQEEPVEEADNETEYASETVVVTAPLSYSATSTAQAQWGLASGTSAPFRWVGSGTLTKAMTYANGLSSGTAYIQLLSDVKTSAPLEFVSGKTTILDLNGKTIDRDLYYMTVTNGNVITLKGKLTLCDTSADALGKITGGNNSSGYGGGVYVNGGNFIMNSGTISGNIGGGGVFIYDGYFTMNGGSISKNNGGVDVGPNSTFIMNGGSISGNKSFGVEVVGSFTMNNGTISENVAKWSSGGGVIVVNLGRFTMNNGSIVKNTVSESGGGVLLYGSNPKVSINGGSISENTTTDSVGGGVCVKSGVFNVSGSPKISNNKMGSGESLQDSNVYLCDNKKITVGTLTDGASIGVTMSTGEGTFSYSGATYANSNYFTSDEDAYTVAADGSGLQLIAPEAQWGLASGEAGDKAPTSWTDGTLSQAMTYANNLASGTAYIQLLKDVATTTPLSFSSGKTTILDLNGKTIDRGLPKNTDAGNVITTNGKLTLCDTSESALGKITGGYNQSNGGGVHVKSGTFIMNSGSISGNTAAWALGGGVYVGSGTFIMNGGSISNNTATDYYGGGGVYVDGGTFTMNDGSISKNIATGSSSIRGGGVNVYGGTFTMTGGTISENSSVDGGGLFLYDATATVNNGSISGNSAIFGGGVEVGPETTFTMNGGTISGNNATDSTNKYACRGGGVYISGGTFIMTDGSIYGNNHDRGSGGGSGGGVCFERGAMQVSGTPVISGNTKDGTLNSTTGLYEQGANGSANNVSRFSNYITVVDALEDGASISVYTASTIVANGGTNPTLYTLTASDAAKFFGDDGSFGVLDRANNRVKLSLNANSTVTVSGTITSFLDETADVTIELFAAGSTTAKYTTTVKGNTTAYSIEGVEAGTYTMKVSKANHVTREYTVVVADENVTQDVKICPKGDVNLDGEVNADDLTALARHVARIENLTDSYALLNADVDGDGDLTAVDLTKLARYVARIIPEL